MLPELLPPLLALASASLPLLMSCFWAHVLLKIFYSACQKCAHVPMHASFNIQVKYSSSMEPILIPKPEFIETASVSLWPFLPFQWP